MIHTSNFNKQKYSERIKALTDRARQGSAYTKDIDIGESCYLLSLTAAVRLFRTKCMSSNELYHKQKELEAQLLKYYQHEEIYNLHIHIRNQYSELLTEAGKCGCSICKRLVRILDGSLPL